MSWTRVSIRFAAGRPEQLDLLRRQIPLGDDPGPQRVVDVVVDVGDPVHDPSPPSPPASPASRARCGAGSRPAPARSGSAPAHRPPAARPPAASARCGESRRPCSRSASSSTSSPMWPNGRVAEVVAEPDRLGQVLVQPQRPRHRARDEAGLERVGEPGPVVVALGRDEHLRLVLEAPERLRVDDPVAVALERRPHRAVGLRLAAIRRVGGRRGLPEVLGLPGADPVLERGDACASSPRCSQSRRPAGGHTRRNVSK